MLGGPRIRIRYEMTRLRWKIIIGCILVLALACDIIYGLIKSISSRTKAVPTRFESAGFPKS